MVEFGSYLKTGRFPGKRRIAVIASNLVARWRFARLH
jgi:hypothetical protein